MAAMSGQRDGEPQANVQRSLTLYHDIEQDIDSDADPEECRRVLREFLALEARYEVPVTYNVVGKLFREQPELIGWISDAGQELAFHSYSHPPQWQPAIYADEVALCRDVSSEPTGYRSPRSEWNESTLVSAWDNGFLWNAESDATGSPYFIHSGLVRLPIAGDDWPLHSGAATAEAWVEGFRGLLGDDGYFGFGSHDSVAGMAPDERLAAWEQVLQAAVRSGRKLLTFSDAADLFRRSALADHYSSTAATWNEATQGLYRTHRFREMIRAEAERLDRPAVADLGSGGGVLTTSLGDLASVIYCVDSSEGMLGEVEADGRVRAQLGDVTDSGLPDHSIDLVVCARVIEYLFWPDRLADEIRRIGKPGATYFVTFPADRGETPVADGSPDNRIRRYFTAEAVQRWASQIGPGRLAGVQYDPAEPEDQAAMDRYRAMDQDPPAGVLPTNWVYIGRVAGG
jgi:SAM-dependent methyltransferase/peptidoglycan/xylan/chitin deacetylase (PgdA/CDA1 family)